MVTKLGRPAIIRGANEARRNNQPLPHRWRHRRARVGRGARRGDGVSRARHAGARAARGQVLQARVEEQAQEAADQAGAS